MANYKLCCALFFSGKTSNASHREVLEERQERIEDDLDKAETLKRKLTKFVLSTKKLFQLQRKGTGRDPPRPGRNCEAECRSESAAQVKVTVMLEEAEKRIAASKTGAEGTSGDPISSLERSVAQEVVANAVQKLIGVDVTAADIDAAIAATLEERPQ